MPAKLCCHRDHCDRHVNAIDIANEGAEEAQKNERETSRPIPAEWHRGDRCRYREIRWFWCRMHSHVHPPEDHYSSCGFLLYVELWVKVNWRVSPERLDLAFFSRWPW